MSSRKLKHILYAGVTAGILMSGAQSCVTVDTSLGHGYMPLEQQYDVFISEWDLTDISQRRLSDMSGYSTRRVTFGSIYDDEYGLIRKSSAFSVIPVVDSLDFGKDPEFVDFYFSMERDTLNMTSSSQMNILQNVYVYPMDESGKSLDSLSYIGELKNSMFDGSGRIARGAPVYAGGDSLVFRIGNSYGQKLLDRFIAKSTDGLYILDSIPGYITDVFPGIYICTDDQIGNGGRINMFNLNLDVEDNYVMGNFAELKFRSTYDNEKKDTSFLFLFGAASMPESSTNLPSQYAFNCTEIVGGKEEGAVTDRIHIEGGDGVKPVISGKEVFNLLLEEFSKNPNVLELGVDPSQIIINKASVDFPFELPADYNRFEAYPEILSPCCRVKGYDSLGVARYTYANLTDASISAEKHGAIDRSNLMYSADISFHAQKLISLEEPADTTLENYDIWFLITKAEINEDSSSSSSSNNYNDYLNQMYYYNYLNQLYGGYGGYGYGGYGSYGYGGYGGYGYNNYYSMMLYSSMLNSSGSSSQTSTSEELDRDRFYGATLYGPANADRHPKLRVTYSVPKRAIE